MEQTNTIIVISRYEKDMHWTKKFVEHGFRVLVYEHEKIASHPYFVNENKGREASIYLKYIIDYYDNLTPYTIFLQDSEKSWHHEGSIVDLVHHRVGKKDKFYNFNNRCLALIEPNNLYPMMVEYFNKYLAPYIGDIEKYGDWTAGYKCCSQFVVHKNTIRRYPKKMFEDMLAYMLDGRHDEKAKGHMFEWTLHLMFDNPLTMHKMSPKKYREMMEKRKKKINNAVRDKKHVFIDGCRVIISYGD